MMARCTVESMICGYREYINIWANSVIKEDLSCKQEIGNAHNTHAVAVHKIIDGEINTTILTSSPRSLCTTNISAPHVAAHTSCYKTGLSYNWQKNLVNW